MKATKRQAIIDRTAELIMERGNAAFPDRVVAETLDMEVTTSYVNKIRNNYEGEIEDRLVVATDGEGTYQFELTGTETWKLIRSAPKDESRQLFEQFSRQR